MRKSIDHVNQVGEAAAPSVPAWSDVLHEPEQWWLGLAGHGENQAIDVSQETLAAKLQAEVSRLEPRAARAQVIDKQTDAMRARLAARPDTEHEQAIVRLMVGTVLFFYLLPEAYIYREGELDLAHSYFAVMCLFLLCAAAIFIAYPFRREAARRGTEERGLFDVPARASVHPLCFGADLPGPAANRADSIPGYGTFTKRP